MYMNWALRWFQDLLCEGEISQLITSRDFGRESSIPRRTKRCRWEHINTSINSPSSIWRGCTVHQRSGPRPGGFRGRIEDKQRQFMAPDEQIYAVQYRKVRWRWFASNKTDEMMLAKKAWWERYDGPRYLESEPEDMVEVELEDEITLEGDHNECAIESGKVFVSAV
ncbi:hypothetical protein K469DRAFT_690905 [Zopfia rhizophila CBS 207.26]|uniref:Uncharacterized protein n=1 Tax=Zopfia rhizophila CBS 207.26 TaxID=1314779 RepID=A0A6A6DVR8_9PEZI|nr:hypothetical protein K469DRAFT_690905 [Zopfia rhizophila CBS 207.26]